MATESVHVVAHISAKPEAARTLHELLLALLEPTRREAGCIHYRLLQNKANPAAFIFIEEWVDDAAIDAHMTAEHVQKAFANAQPLLAAAPAIQRYRLTH